MKASCVSVLLFAVAVVASHADETNLTLTVDGVIYSNVTFRTVTISTVSIFHKTGIATVPLAKLPPDLQQRFGYDPAKAAARLKSQQKETFRRDWTDAIAKKQQPRFREIAGAVYDFSAVVEWVRYEGAARSSAMTFQNRVEFAARYNMTNPDPGFFAGDESLKKGAAIYNAGVKKWAGYQVRGSVISVLPEGVLVRANVISAPPEGVVFVGGEYRTEQTVFLKHHPDQSSLVDNAIVDVLAMPVEKFSYTTTSDSKATVKAYDFGRQPTWKEGQQIVPLPPLSE